MKLFISILILFAGCHYDTPPPTPTPTPNKPYLKASDIVVCGASTEAAYLRYSLQQVYDTSLGFSYSPKDTSKNNLIVGDTVLSPCSFIIRKEGKNVIIKGVDRTGRMEGVRYFLDRYANTRYYLPDSLFTQLGKGVVLPDSTVIQSPSIENVVSTGFRTPEEWKWSFFEGLGRNDILYHAHTFSQLFFDSSIIHDYPKAFGNHVPTSATDEQFTPDFAEPTLVDASIAAAKKFFATHQTNYIAFSVMDAGVSIGAATQKFLLNYPNTPAGFLQGCTDANAIYLNNVAARMRTEIPGKTIVYLVYSGIRNIPTVKLDSSILPVLVQQIAEQPTTTWTGELGEHDWAEGMGFIYPKIYTHNVSNFVRKNRLKFWAVETYPNWGLDGLKLYEMGRIFWNSQVNVDSILHLFCTDMFGKASGEMEAYFNELEAMNNVSTNLYQYKGQLTQPAEVMQSLRTHLDNALKLSGSDSLGVDYFNQGFKIFEGAWKVAHGEDYDYATFLKSIVGKNLLYIASDSTFIPGLIKSLK
jgi:hypothetical protein